MCTHRALRTGDPAVVLAAGKTAAQVLSIAAALRSAEPERPALITRANERVAAELTAAHPYATSTATIAIGPLPEPGAGSRSLTAGTSDAPLAAGAASTARAFAAAVFDIDNGFGGVFDIDIDIGFGAGVFAARVACARTVGTPPAEATGAAG